MFGKNAFEKLKNFRGGNDRYIHSSDFIELFADVIDLALYKKLQLRSEAKKADRIYSDNQTFWRDTLAGRQFQGVRLFLKGFHLTEWMPSSPGRYFSPDAERSREEALRFINPRDENEYIPLGKNYMVLGGIGSVRLAAKSINSKVFYFLGASSTGVSHQGVPVAMSESQYHEVMPLISEHGGCLVNLVGSLQVLPTLVHYVRYDNGIPKYCFYVEDVKVNRVSLETELLTSISIMFPSDYSQNEFLGDGLITNLIKSWSFCSFRPTSLERLKSAVNWLQDYVNRYSYSENQKPVPILSDFDEVCNHFENPIEFPIKQIFEGVFNNQLLNAYQQAYHFQVNVGELIMTSGGDVFQNITDSTIVNKSIVEASFNKVKEEFDSETANALKVVAAEIEKSGNKEAAELFESFNEELQKPEPKRSVLRNFWNGIVEILPQLSSLAEVAVKISTLFA